MYGPETKRTLLPSQVTGIDTVKALFVRAFPDKLTMNYLDDEQSNKIYIKDQLKDLFYQLDEMKYELISNKLKFLLHRKTFVLCTL